MKITDAFWEKRNLGVECVEMTIESADSTCDVITNLGQINVPYSVVRVPCGRTDVMFTLSEMGYVYIESLINVVHDLKNIELSGIYRRLNNTISYSEMNDKDRYQLYDEISKGIFTTDRISVDPYFSEDIAARRYINWINDEHEKNTKLYKVCSEDSIIGFFTFKEIQTGVYFPFLAGLYKKYANSGLGFSIIHKTRELAQHCQAKYISTYISTNNIPVLRVHNDLGYVIKGINNIYVKHI